MDEDDASMGRKALWIRPPPHPDYDPASPPQSVLLDALAYIDGERNATTADGFARDRKPIQVSPSTELA